MQGTHEFLDRRCTSLCWALRLEEQMKPKIHMSAIPESSGGRDEAIVIDPAVDKAPNPCLLNQGVVSRGKGLE